MEIKKGKIVGQGRREWGFLSQDPHKIYKM
jgi:hypothetical protein